MAAQASATWTDFPVDLPVPEDDGRAAHLEGMRIPDVTLPATAGTSVTLLKRLTMVVDDGRITKVFYPVFPPDRSAQDVADWLRSEDRPSS